jgi:hypothetical protein
MPTATSDLEIEIQRLQTDLASAQRARVRPEDQRVTELQQKLSDAQHALQLQQEAEAADQAEQQRAHDLQTLTELEDSISAAKAEVDSLRVLSTELPQRLGKAHYQHSQLLQQRTKLKTELGIR